MRRYDNADVAFTMQFIAISLADSNDLPRFLAFSYNSDVAFTMQFIAIFRPDLNDLPRFLAVSLISFISLVEMSLVIILLLDARVVRRNGLLEMPIFLIR